MSKFACAAAVVFAAGWSVANAGASVDPPPGGLGQREQLLAAFRQLPTPQLRARFMHCDREARVRLMSLDEGALCAMTWDELLRRDFGGDVGALLAWWRSERDRAPSAPQSE